MPLFALDIYPENDKDNLSAADKRQWKAVVDDLVKQYRRAK